MGRGRPASGSQSEHAHCGNWRRGFPADTLKRLTGKKTDSQKNHIFPQFLPIREILAKFFGNYSAWFG